MISRLKSIVDNSPVLSGVNYLKGQVSYRLGARSHLSGATHRELSIDESVSYIRNVVADYLSYAGVDDEFLQHKRILEVGPGDNLGVALSFLAKGAEKVTCIDAFSPLSNEAHNDKIYKRLFETFSRIEQARVESIIAQPNSRSPWVVSNRLEFHYGLPIEKLFERISTKFDLIVSRAVLEHVARLEKVWGAMVKLLAEDGHMWHKVDLRHHGLFAQFHPLYFLRIDPRLWRLISSPDPTLNRERLPKYKQLAAKHFCGHKMLFTHVLDMPEFIPHKSALRKGVDYGEPEIELVRQIRPHLKSAFIEIPDEDLLVTGIFMVCDKKRSQ